MMLTLFFYALRFPMPMPPNHYICGHMSSLVSAFRQCIGKHVEIGLTDVEGCHLCTDEAFALLNIMAAAAHGCELRPA